MDYALLFWKMFPGENVSPVVSSGDYDAIARTWRGSKPIPSLAECQAAWQEHLPEFEKITDPAPDSITMRQLLIGLMGAGWILPTEADAWSADGTLPATITTVIDALPTEAERVAARITARKMSSAYRNDPLLIAAAQAAMPGATEQEISDALDQAFREWSQL